MITIIYLWSPLDTFSLDWSIFGLPDLGPKEIVLGIHNALGWGCTMLWDGNTQCLLMGIHNTYLGMGIHNALGWGYTILWERDAQSLGAGIHTTMLLHFLSIFI